ncbi:MAG TPA: hypothetical protein VIW71_17320, partial [Streptomyces sp.]
MRFDRGAQDADEDAGRRASAWVAEVPANERRSVALAGCGGQGAARPPCEPCSGATSPREPVVQAPRPIRQARTLAAP